MTNIQEDEIDRPQDKTIDIRIKERLDRLEAIVAEQGKMLREMPFLIADAIEECVQQRGIGPGAR